MTNIEVSQAFSSWSNVGRLRYDQHLVKLLTFDQPMTIGDLDLDYVLTNIWLRFDQPHGQKVPQKYSVKSYSFDQPFAKIRLRIPVQGCEWRAVWDSIIFCCVCFNLVCDLAHCIIAHYAYKLCKCSYFGLPISA